jgi:hypothetical protein
VERGVGLFENCVVGKWQQVFHLVWRWARLGIVREGLDVVRWLEDRRIILQSKFDE